MFGVERIFDPIQLKIEIDIYPELNMAQEALDSILQYFKILKPILNSIWFDDSLLKYYSLVSVGLEILALNRNELTGQSKYDPIYTYLSELKT